MVDVLGLNDDLRFAPFDNPAVGTALVGMDGRWLCLSEQFCDMLGYAPDELIDLTIDDITYPADVEVDVPEARRLVAREITTYTTQKRYIRKDGSLICVKLTKSLTIDEHGRPDHFISVVEDIASRRLVNEAFHTLADTIPELCWIADPEGYIVWYNRRWLEYTGKTLAEMWGQRWAPVLEEHAQREVSERWMKSIETGEPFEMIIRIRNRDDVLHQFLTRVAPLRDEGGHVVRWFGTNTDIEGVKLASTN